MKWLQDWRARRTAARIAAETEAANQKRIETAAEEKKRKEDFEKQLAYVKEEVAAASTVGDHFVDVNWKYNHKDFVEVVKRAANEDKQRIVTFQLYAEWTDDDDEVWPLSAMLELAIPSA
ncbi:MAG: hypothetical protein AAB790_03335 [Patescibacteria group bacterium]